ncbi:cystathionine gamma-lyase [Gulosibacter chungangensis]|uniref:Cystathionine gamma-lyase n=1 Tax=Gulosibacter chungangensis TaxID=979746 RepID=A0A7J5BCV7_9MICO|nr:cystathionine gamma-lyase [Gulosibacter chungangensis]KAB1644045.1 cystathionine gamma-lyase [Gulosibacter chungangensis]
MPNAENSSHVAKMLHRRAGTLRPGDPLVPPLVAASAFLLPGEPNAPFGYGRWNTPTWAALETSLSILEDADTVIFPSGMAAIAAVLMTQLEHGDRVLLPSDGYYNTRSMAEKYLTPQGVQIELCATPDYGDKDFTGFKLVFVETPSNPRLDVCEIADVARRAHRAGALVVVDNTTMTVLGQQPLNLGADIVVASDTKALNGHSDALLGHVASRDASVLDAVREWRTLAGGIPGQLEAWLVHRGLESFELRYERMCTSAGLIAERFLEHPAIVDVVYPGLPTHPAREIVARQMSSGGSLVGVTFAHADAAEQFITRAEYVIPATSFGGTHTTAERRARWGDEVAAGFVRLSVGCEPTEVLWQDFAATLQELS